MLRKLIKYDIKANIKLFLLLHGVLIAACIVGRLAFLDRLDFELPEEPLVTAIAIFASAYLFLFMAVCFCTWLMIAFRFYRNLFGKEGYLTWTLPVSGVQHLWAKIISGTVYLVADAVIVSICIPFLVSGRNVVEAYGTIAADVTAEFGMPISTLYVYTCIYMVLSCVVAVVMTYFCVAAGQLFPGHRVLCAVAAYLITSFVIQIVSTVLMSVLELFPLTVMPGWESLKVGDYMLKIYAFSVAIMVAVMVLEYMAAHWIMKKKINLI